MPESSIHREAQTGRTFRVLLDTLEGPRTVFCEEQNYILDAALQQGVPLPYICKQGRCLTCAGKLISGEVDQRDAVSYFPEDRAAGFVLLCRAHPQSDVQVLTLQATEMREHRKALGLPAPYA